MTGLSTGAVWCRAKRHQVNTRQILSQVHLNITTHDVRAAQRLLTGVHYSLSQAESPADVIQMIIKIIELFVSALAAHLWEHAQYRPTVIL